MFATHRAGKYICGVWKMQAYLLQYAVISVFLPWYSDTQD